MLIPVRKLIGGAFQFFDKSGSEIMDLNPPKVPQPQHDARRRGFGRPGVASVTEMYRQSVERLARDAVRARITNTGHEHSMIAFDQIFAHATDIVRVYTAQTSDLEFLMPMIQTFLAKPNTELRILLQRYSSTPDPTRELTPALRKRAIVRYARTFIGSEFFTIGDSRSYRLEMENEVLDAVVSFNEPDIAVRLSRQFDRGFHEAGQPLVLTMGGKVDAQKDLNQEMHHD